MASPGVEPGSAAYKAAALTVVLGGRCYNRPVKGGDDMSDTTELENQVGNAVDILMDISRQLDTLSDEIKRIKRDVNDIERKLR